MIFIEGKLCNSSIISIEEFFSNLSLVNIFFFKLCEVNLDVLFDDFLISRQGIFFFVRCVPQFRNQSKKRIIKHKIKTKKKHKKRNE